MPGAAGQQGSSAERKVWWCMSPRVSIGGVKTKRVKPCTASRCTASYTPAAQAWKGPLYSSPLQQTQLHYCIASLQTPYCHCMSFCCFAANESNTHCSPAVL